MMLESIKNYKKRTVLAKLLKTYTHLQSEMWAFREVNKDIMDLQMSKFKLELSKLAMHFDNLRASIPGQDELNSSNYWERLKKPDLSDGRLCTLAQSSPGTSFQGVSIGTTYSYEEMEQEQISHIQDTVHPAFVKAFQDKFFKDCVKEAKTSLDMELTGLPNMDIYDLYTLTKTLDGRNTLLPDKMAFTLNVRPALAKIAKKHKTNLIILRNT